jgi:hypothetical protein
MNYLFRQKDDYEEHTTLVRFHGEELSEVVTKFREFLLGAGFGINNVNAYVPDPDEIDCCMSIDGCDSGEIPNFLRKDGDE